MRTYRRCWRRLRSNAGRCELPCPFCGHSGPGRGACPDLDTPATESNSGLIERGSNEAKSSAVDALRSTTEGIVPFRGWVRKLSGAERYSHKVAASIAAGTVRRAFL